MDRPVNPDEADVATEAPAATRKHSLRMILFLLLAILAAFGLWRFLASRPTGEKKMEAPVTQVGAAKSRQGRPQAGPLRPRHGDADRDHHRAGADRGSVDVGRLSRKARLVKKGDFLAQIDDAALSGVETAI